MSETKPIPKTRTIPELLHRLMAENTMYPDPPDAPSKPLEAEDRKKLAKAGVAFKADDGQYYLTHAGRIEVAGLRAKARQPKEKS